MPLSVGEDSIPAGTGKRVTSQTLIGEAGVALVARRVNAMGYLFHDRRIDHGIDGEIELVADGTALNRVIAVQVKASNRPFQKETAETFEWTADANDLSYWLHGNVPVIVVLSHPDRDEAWWTDARDCLSSKNGRTFTIRKRDQAFGRSAAPALMRLATENPGQQEARAAFTPLPVWWMVQARNLNFTGRDEELTAIREMLESGDSPVLELHGMGGVGKTQLALEYAHRHSDDYDLVWWLDAENTALFRQQFADLASALGCTADGNPADVDMLRRTVLSELRRRPGWLIIFDNAEHPDILRDWLPSGSGHVLLTSRAPVWDKLAVPFPVDVLTRTESVALLRGRVPGLPEQDAAALAEALGDLPLATAQAAAYLTDTRRPADEYLGILQDRASELLAENEREVYRPGGLTAVTHLAYDQLRSTDPDAALLISALAFLAPEPVSVDWLVTAAAGLPRGLASRVAEPLALSRLLSAMTRTALVRLTDDGLTMHRLTQAILRATTPPQGQADPLAVAEEVVTANSPGDRADDPGTWPAWSRLLPHLLSVDPARSDSPALHSAATRAVLYLTASGNNGDAAQLGILLYNQWLRLPDPSGMRTLEIANATAEALRAVGEFGSAKQLDDMVYGRCRFMFGNDHWMTLAAANSLGLSLLRLGELHQARILLEDTLRRRRQALGPDDPGTLTVANSLALTLRELEDYAAARELDEDTVERCRRTLGDDHLDTLRTASNLAPNLHFLGLYSEACALNMDTLDRYRRILGDDHPHTLRTASNLAKDLCELGENQKAIDIYKEVLARRQQLLGNDHPDTRRAANNLLSTLKTVGDHETALAVLVSLGLLS